MTLFKRYKPYYIQNLMLALPVIISQLGQHTVQLVDAMMVGRLKSPDNPAIGSEGLASLSLANSVVWPIMLLGMGMAMGLTPLVGRSHIRGDFDRTTSFLKNSLLLNAIFCGGMLILLTGGYFLLGNMGQDPKIIPLAKEYYLYMIASVIPIMVFSTGRQFLEGLGNTTYSMYIVITSNVFNVIMNFCLIYGLWIFPERGAIGAGESTFYARLLQALLMLLLFVRREQYRKYLRGFGSVSFNIRRLRRLANIGFPISLQIFIEMAAFSLMAIMVGTFGAQALAAHQIAINIPSTTFMVILGLQSATMIRVSQNYGLRLYDQMNMSYRASQHLVVAFMCFMALIIITFARPIASLFSTESDVIDMAAKFLVFGAIFQLPDGIQGIGLGGLRGMMVVKRPMYYAIATYIFVAIPVGYLLSYVFGMGPYGTWVGFITALTIFAVLYNRLFIKKLNELKKWTQ